jgi:uncharacterized protein YegJ (DUF2314 family)
MDAAIGEARRSLDTFIAFLASPREGQTYFGIKARFPIPGAPGEHEHIWLSDVRYEGDRFRARIGSEPLSVDHLQPSDEVVVRIEDVTDWMIIENGALLGGYTARVLRDRMTDQEKKEFDRSAGVAIPDD